MANKKSLEYDGIGVVSFVKRKGQKSLRIKITHNKVTVSMPRFAPYIQAQKYLESKLDWVKDNLRPEQELVHGMHIGKNHILRIGTGDGNRSKISDNEILVCGDKDHIRKTVHRALKKQSEKLLTQRVQSFADKMNEEFSALKFRQMVGRWGSCSSSRELTFNIYLIQLPWELIDYVIVHELCHLEHMNHSKDFWQHVKNNMPDYKERRSKLRDFRPVIYNTSYA